MQGVTERQQSILVAIMEYTEKNKYAPSIRELCEMVGLRSSSTMHRHLENLKLLGLITWEPSAPRTITVVQGEDIAV
ncbi:transcriptional regulator [Brevibacillus borstelensis]|uniref:LexA family protein n=1 Tax=Brevibacillus borstelensis TaxID=45462 RepID=UPI003CE4F168